MPYIDTIISRILELYFTSILSLRPLNLKKYNTFFKKVIFINFPHIKNSYNNNYILTIKKLPNISLPLPSHIFPILQPSPNLCIILKIPIPKSPFLNTYPQFKNQIKWQNHNKVPQEYQA